MKPTLWEFRNILDGYVPNHCDLVADGTHRLRIVLASDDLLADGVVSHLPLTTKSQVTTETHYPNAKGVWTKK